MTLDSHHESNKLMKKSEQAKVSEGVDMISNLPDHLLLLILSRLPGTEDAIRTSILSTRWKSLWTSIPSIDIDYTRGSDPLHQWDIDEFKDFVYWVLLNKPQDLDRFRLSCSDYYNMSTIRKWIHAAVMRKVKLLDLKFRPRRTWEFEKIEVPHCLVTCGSLEVLRLHFFGRRLHLPDFTGFSALKALELNEVELFDNYIVKYFIENCPLLEDLSLIDCRANLIAISSPKLKNLRIETRQLVTGREKYLDGNLDLDWKMCLSLQISCPKLVFLKLKGYVAMKFLFDDLDSLEKAEIHPENLFTCEEPVYDLFNDMFYADVLSISLYFVGQCYYPKVEEVFLPNLKTLELTVDGSKMSVLIPFLKCLPDLESLHLIFTKNVYGLYKWNLEEAETINILTHHLKKVEFLDFDKEKPKLVVARALLEHGNELEEMVFSWGNEARFHERSKETMKEVSKFHKASSTVKLRCVTDSILVESS